ncbi:hypothetical protein EV2_012329 [Malus domestica]
MAILVELTDRDSLVKSASTSLNSKVVNQYLTLFAPMAIDAVLSVVDLAKPEVVDLRDIRITKKLRGTVDDIETVKGLVFDKKASYAAGGPTRMKNAKIAVIQFQTMTNKKKTKYVVVEDNDNDMANEELLSVEKLFGNQSCRKLYQKLQTTKFKRKVRCLCFCFWLNSQG